MPPLTAPPLPRRRTTARGPSSRLLSRAPGDQPDSAAFLGRPASILARAGLAALNLAAAAFFLLSYSRHGVGFGPYHIDLDVYRIGGRVWLHGGNLYSRLPETRAGIRLPFTYPPAAAILLSPLALIPFPAAATMFTLVSIVLLAAVLGCFLRRLGAPATRSPWQLAWLLPPALLLEPVRDTLTFGQINIVLMALVTADSLAEAPRWPRGALTGLAAAVKLTPAAFIVFFLLRKDYRAARTAAASFAATTAVGFAAAWHDSVRYWTGTAAQTARIGNPAYASNQCVLAVLARAGLAPHTPACVGAWLALSAVVAAAAWRGMRHAFAASEDCLALSLNAVAALLISPVSWSHHWVWCAPGILTLALAGRRYRARLLLAAAAAGVAVFAAAPQMWLPSGSSRELHWTAWQQAAGSSYVIFAALMLLLAASRKLAPPPKGQPEDRDVGASSGADPGRAGGYDPAMIERQLANNGTAPRFGPGRRKRRRRAVRKWVYHCASSPVLGFLCLGSWAAVGSWRRSTRFLWPLVASSRSWRSRVNLVSGRPPCGARACV